MMYKFDNKRLKLDFSMLPSCQLGSLQIRQRIRVCKTPPHT